jgi:hypothetical protein
MQPTPAYRTSRDLFSTRYLEDVLPETAAWNASDTAELRETYDTIREHWERETGATSSRADGARDEPFVRRVARALDIPADGWRKADGRDDDWWKADSCDDE